MFTRWAHTFEDMAALTPRITLRFLDGLLPHCERTSTGWGSCWEYTHRNTYAFTARSIARINPRR